MIAPSKVNAAAKKLEDENMRFRSFLKNNADSDELDKQFAELHNELFSTYDCRQCKNCCRMLGTTVEEEEVDPITIFLGLPKQRFMEKYLEELEEGGYEMLAPCAFLKENGECAIQSCKPSECRDFPYTDKPERLDSLYNILSFAEKCPVVFEMLERLKDAYGFRR